MRGSILHPFHSDCCVQPGQLNWSALESGAGQKWCPWRVCQSHAARCRPLWHTIGREPRSGRALKIACSHAWATSGGGAALKTTSLPLDCAMEAGAILLVGNHHYDYYYFTLATTTMQMCSRLSICVSFGAAASQAFSLARNCFVSGEMEKAHDQKCAPTCGDAL